MLVAVRVAYRMVPCPPRLTLSRYDEYAAPCSRVADVTDSKQHSDPLEVLAAIISPLNHLSQDHGEGARRNLAAVREHIRHLEEQLEAMEERWRNTQDRLDATVEQLETAQFALDGSHARGYREGVREEQARHHPDITEYGKLEDENKRLKEQLEAAAGLLQRAMPLTNAVYQKRRGAVVQPLRDDIKAWLESNPASRPE